ncbi:hypothetical protein CCR96_19615 [Halochromatium roseum]|nr:hypothetical protein [Halochromatium roseum]
MVRPARIVHRPLSRTQLVRAATGKEGDTARTEARRFGDAGEVIAHLIEQCDNDVTLLLSTDSNRRLHLVELKQSPRELWPMLAGLLVEHDWSVKEVKAAVERLDNRLLGPAQYQSRRAWSC